MASPLVYPRQLPSKVPSSYDGIDSEDSKDPVVMDYLKITIYDSQKGNPYTFVGDNAPGLQNANNSAHSRGETIGATIYLYLPNNLSESYNTIYNEATLGAAGAAAAQAMGGSIVNGGDGIKTLQQFARTAAPEFAAGAAAAALGAVNSGLGIEGNLTGQDLVAITSRKIFNPYQEVTFRGVNYREHTFTFKLAPRNYAEANECNAIVQILRRAMLPKVSGASSDFDSFRQSLQQQNEGINPNVATAISNVFSTGEGGSISGSRYLNIPDYFRLNVVRVTGKPGDVQEVGKGGRLSSIMRFPTKMVLTGFNLNLTPDGHLNTLKDIRDGITDYGPAAMDLTLTFKETAFITQDMVS